MNQETLIRKLVDSITLNAYSVNSAGIYNGKAGIAFALFEAARYLQDVDLENKAFNLLQESILRSGKNYSFENGLPGIGYILIYLITNKFIDADFEDVFEDQYEEIIKTFENVDKKPDTLLNSIKIIYFMSAVSKIKNKDKRVNVIIEKIFQGIELYLSIQFFDFKNTHYINNKTTVLKIYETYLALIDYSSYSNFSNYLLKAYAELYRNDKIMSSFLVGCYLDKTVKFNNINGYDDIIESNINNGIQSIQPDYLPLKELIVSMKLVKLINEKCNDSTLLYANSLSKDMEYKIIKALQPNSSDTRCQFDAAHCLIHIIDESIYLL